MISKTSEPPAAPAAPPNLLEGLASLIQDLTAKVDALQQRVDRGMPGVSPMRAPDAPVRRFKPGERRQDSQTLPTTVGGKALDADELRIYPRRFEPGQTVVINRDATRFGSGATWGEILDKLGVVYCPGRLANREQCRAPLRRGSVCTVCGTGPEVARVMWLDKDGEWKYKVRVPGLTAHQGDGFRESELSFP